MSIIRHFLYFFFIITGSPLFSQHINVGLYNYFSLNSFLFEPIHGKYIIKSNNKQIYQFKKNDAVYIKYNGNSFTVRSVDLTIGNFNNLYFEIYSGFFDRLLHKFQLDDYQYRIKTTDPDIKERFYQYELKIKTNRDNSIAIISDINFNQYLAGVVQAEAGFEREPEFYKAQAIICRTYALKYANKHKADGYQICDHVHCQAFKGTSKNHVILKAIEDTDGLVLVDSSGAFIDAVFSANCGGELVPSEDLWGQSLPYLKKNNDPYCITEKQATWSKTVTIKEWQKYLAEYGFKITDDTSDNYFDFDQPERKIYYEIKGNKLSLNRLRSNFKLRSTFFSVSRQDGLNLLLNGRGYGHGIGMCQEGGMNMAKKGFKFDQIINFYYPNIKIIKVKI